MTTGNGSFTPTSRTTIGQLTHRAVYDREVVHGMIDEALVCHVGFVDKGQPFVIPTIHVRVGDTLYLHGSRASRMIRCLCAGAAACVTISLLDGLVLARSAFHHSMNYRSVVILGVGRDVTDAREKDTVLKSLVEHVVPGRSAEARMPTPNERNATAIVGFAIEETSAKVRTGPPVDDEPDYDLAIWAGVLPLALVPQAPVDDPRLTPGIDVPRYVSEYCRPGRLT